MSVIKEIELFYQEGSSDKVYNAMIVKDGDAFTVKVAWGRRGSTLNTVRAMTSRRSSACERSC